MAIGDMHEIPSIPVSAVLLAAAIVVAVFIACCVTALAAISYLYMHSTPSVGNYTYNEYTIATPTPSSDECAFATQTECLSEDTFKVRQGPTYRDCDDWDSDGKLEWTTFRCPPETVCPVGESKCRVAAAIQ